MTQQRRPRFRICTDQVDVQVLDCGRSNGDGGCRLAGGSLHTLQLSESLAAYVSVIEDLPEEISEPNICS